jgi:phospholipid/cholesterol/gamma-HCH transport system substrate-binding protein
MPRFREFNVLKTAIVGLAITTGFLAAAFAFPTLPFVRGPSYTALFTDGGGMATGDEVRVAGTAVGKVIDMELVGNRVEVTFTARGIRLGNTTTAAIKTGTLLGKRYLGVIPGSGPEMDAGDTIPMVHTTAPYNVTKSIEDVTTQVHDFDKPQLQAALNAFSEAFRDTPENFKATFSNVKALSETINSRDGELRELLSHANGVTAVLNDRTAQFESLLIDGSTLLHELQRRREYLDDIFRQFNYVTEEIPKFVDQNDAQLGHVLDNLNELLDIVEKNDQSLGMAIQRVSSFIDGLGEGVANGPGFSASLALNSVGEIFNYTDLLRQVNNPQAPRIPAMPGLPGIGELPNPLGAPPSGAGADRPAPVPGGDSAYAPALPLMGGGNG